MWFSLPAYDYAEEFLRLSPDHRVIILRGYEYPAERVGALPTFANNVEQRLLDREIPASQIQRIDERIDKGTAYTDEERCRVTQAWLDEHPGEHLIIATNRFGGGVLQDASSNVLSPEQLDRVHVVGLAIHGIDEKNWWKSSAGIKSFLYDWLLLSHYWIFGDQPIDESWDPDEYEADLQAKHAAAFNADANQKPNAELIEAGA